jgi:hypothetical protein
MSAIAHRFAGKFLERGERYKSKDRSLRQLLQTAYHPNVGAAEGCDLLMLIPAKTKTAPEGAVSVSSQPSNQPARPAC